MITANVIHRIFRIKLNDCEGTAFTIEVDGREYLITAKHVVETVNTPRDIQLFSNRKWIPLPVQLVGHASQSDISVLAVDRLLTPPKLPMPATSKGVIYGQDVYFLGFPYGYLGKYHFGPRGYPLPFVKKAIVSLLDNKTFLLDGHNNPGFSGGPVVFRIPGQQVLNVAAVISAYRYVEEPIYSGKDKTKMTYRYNTGIIVSYCIDEALDLISSRPIGFPTEKGS